MLIQFVIALFLCLSPLSAQAADLSLQSVTLQVNPVGSDTDHEWLSILWSQPIIDFEATAWRITINGKSQKLFTDDRLSAPCYAGQTQRWLVVDNFDQASTIEDEEPSSESRCWLRTNLALSNQLNSLNRIELSRLSPERLDWSLEWQNADWSEQGYPLLWTTESWRYLPFLDRLDWGQTVNRGAELKLSELLIDPPGVDSEQERIKIVSKAPEPLRLADYYIRIEDKLERLPHQLIEPGQEIEIQLQRLTLPNRSFELALLRPGLQAKQTLADLWSEQKRPVTFTPKYSGWYQLTEDGYRSIPESARLEPSPDPERTQSSQPSISPIESSSPVAKSTSSKNPTRSVNETMSTKSASVKTQPEASLDSDRKSVV